MQAAINTIGSVALAFAQWLISVVLVRMDGFETAGIFSLAMSIGNIFSSIAYYNLRNFRITDVNGEFTQRQYFTASLMATVVSLAAFVAYIVPAGGYTTEERVAIAIYLLYLYWVVASDTIYAYVQVKGRLEFNGYSNVLRAFFAFVFFVATFWLTRSLIQALLAMAFSDILVVFLFDVPVYKRVTGEKIAFFGDNFKGVLRLLKKCFPLMLASVIPFCVTAMPRRAIQMQLGEEQLGFFSSAFTVTVLISTMVPVISYAFLPGLAKQWNEGDWKRMLRSMIGCYGGITLFMLLALAVAALLGRPVMRLIFGEEILAYFELVYWSIIASSTYALSFVGNGILTTMRKSGTVTTAIFAALIVMTLSANGFVSRFGIYGGAYAMIASYFAQDVIQGTAIFTGILRLRK